MKEEQRIFCLKKKKEGKKHWKKAYEKEKFKGLKSNGENEQECFISTNTDLSYCNSLNVLANRQKAKHLKTELGAKVNS